MTNIVVSLGGKACTEEKQASALESHELFAPVKALGFKHYTHPAFADEKSVPFHMICEGFNLRSESNADEVLDAITAFLLVPESIAMLEEHPVLEVSQWIFRGKTSDALKRPFDLTKRALMLDYGFLAFLNTHEVEEAGTPPWHGTQTWRLNSTGVLCKFQDDLQVHGVLGFYTGRCLQLSRSGLSELDMEEYVLLFRELLREIFMHHVTMMQTPANGRHRNRNRR